MTFRSSGVELDALSNLGHPFFKPRWLPDIVGMVAELITESYCLLAPKKLVQGMPGFTAP